MVFTAELVSSLLIPDHNLAFGISFILFTFVLLPTLFVLMTVIIFFLVYYPKVSEVVKGLSRIHKQLWSRIRIETIEISQTLPLDYVPRPSELPDCSMRASWFVGLLSFPPQGPTFFFFFFFPTTFFSCAPPFYHLRTTSSRCITHNAQPDPWSLSLGFNGDYSCTLFLLFMPLLVWLRWFTLLEFSARPIDYGLSRLWSWIPQRHHQQ